MIFFQVYSVPASGHAHSALTQAVFEQEHASMVTTTRVTGLRSSGPMTHSSHEGGLRVPVDRLWSRSLSAIHAVAPPACVAYCGTPVFPEATVPGLRCRQACGAARVALTDSVGTCEWMT
jgi:hypothetical protein